MKGENELGFLNHLIDPSQSSEAWHGERIGKFTSSTNYKLIPSGKRKMTDEELAKRPKNGEGSRTTYVEDITLFSDGCKTHILEKVAEELTGHSNSFVSNATEWGKTYEDVARIEYEKKTGLSVDVIGFREFGEDSGGTVDGIIHAKEYRQSIIEIKCPYNSTNHIDYLLNIKDTKSLKEHKPEYYWQMVSNMIFMDCRHGTFISFDPRFPEGLRLHIVEVDYIQEDAKLLKIKVEAASKEKQRILTQIKSI